jgi:iron complex transport system permease protein
VSGLVEGGSALLTRRRTLRLAGDRYSMHYTRRALIVGTVLALAVLMVLIISLATGDFVIPVPDVLSALTGSGNPADDFIVVSLRLPRALTAIGAGAALGAAGAVFQSVTRNPLGSPDVIGFTRGATVGAVLDLTVFNGNAAQVAFSAIIGGLATAIVVYLLAYRGGVHGYRLVLAGIGVNAMLLAGVQFLLTRADLTDAFDATIWLIGSLNGVGYAQVTSLGVALAVLLPVLFALAHRLNIAEMGEDTAIALGVRVERDRLYALTAAVLLSAVATACVGPVTFVALSAPQLARRLTGATGVGVLPAALMGALVLSVSDLGAQHVFTAELPVGTFTGVVGGGYLAWLLARQWRTR